MICVRLLSDFSSSVMVYSLYGTYLLGNGMRNRRRKKKLRTGDDRREFVFSEDQRENGCGSLWFNVPKGLINWKSC